MHDDAPTPVVTVRTADGLTSRFSRAFHVGRSAECEVRVDDDLVSRKHLLVSLTDGRWGFSDLQSRMARGGVVSAAGRSRGSARA